ncbi:MAG: arylformamidase [Peptococcaceae bacterium BRH_c4b]|nr:MAG: arylformamidase [Peptococcaceae bacterium BRH_c4b]
MQIKKIVDLSVPISNLMQIYPGDPKPEIRPAANLETDGFNLHYINIGSHTGTHVDAPYHFLSTGQRIEQSDLNLFTGEGVVIDVTGKGEQEPIEIKDVENYLERLRPGMIVLFHTGWSKYSGEDKYFRHPYVKVEVVEEMIGRGICSFFIDAPNIDTTGGETFPAHSAIFQINGVIGENLINIEDIDFENPWIVAFPLKIVGCDGSPVRCVALDLE